MQGKSSGSPKKGGFVPGYICPTQLAIPTFETSFEQNLIRDNRWVKLARRISWDVIAGPYNTLLRSKEDTDQETVAQKSGHLCMRSLLGCSSVVQEEPFSHILFVEIRERLRVEWLPRINEIIPVNYTMDKKRA
jgi:hypothetical protein